MERYRDLYIGAGGFRSLVALLAGGGLPHDLIRMVTTVPRRVAGVGPEPLLGVVVSPLEVAGIARHPPSLLRSLSLELALRRRAGVLCPPEPRVRAEELAAEAASFSSSLLSGHHCLFSELDACGSKNSRVDSRQDEEEERWKKTKRGALRRRRREESEGS